MFGVPQERLAGLLAPFGRVEAVGQSFPVYKVVPGAGAGDIDVALPRRESKQGRGHKGFEVAGDPVDVDRRGRPPPRLHDQRHLVGSADRRSTRTRSTDAPTSTAASCAPSIRTTFGDDSLRVLRAVQFAARFEFMLDDDTAALCRRIPLDDLPAERIWGEVEKLLLHAAERPSIGFALALELGVDRPGAAGAAAAGRLRAGAGVASRRATSGRTR